MYTEQVDARPRSRHRPEDPVEAVRVRLARVHGQRLLAATRGREVDGSGPPCHRNHPAGIDGQRIGAAMFPQEEGGVLRLTIAVGIAVTVWTAGQRWRCSLKKLAPAK